ncbi:L-serine ammonia-lyase [Striga asiatica]|uniref:L-serine ammonia-lyase n=1 Tax=Striga asiatica TaxID=4170 RepID=A0A5A7P6Y7_STRAF|nr:L-serine ammonia-lyase [Striga asiatica]
MVKNKIHEATQDALVRIWWILSSVKQVAGGVEEGLGILKPDAAGLVTGKRRLEQAVLRRLLDSPRRRPVTPRLFRPSPKFVAFFLSNINERRREEITTKISQYV